MVFADEPVRLGDTGPCIVRSPLRSRASSQYRVDEVPAASIHA